jgi:Mrp family chromosome partitioning ATPase
MITQSGTRDPVADNGRQTGIERLSESQQLYLSLWRSLPFEGTGSHSRLTTLGITSCYAGEGVSTVATQLSLVAAASGMRVLLVDLNWQRPSIHSYFDVPRAPGVAEALAGGGRLELPVQASGHTNLSLLTIGATDSDFTPTFSLEQMSSLIRTLQSEYDLVVLDLLSSVETGSTASLSGLLDGIVLVVEAERVRWEVALRVKELFVRAGANVLGTVMNKRPEHIPGWLYRTL